MENHLNLLLAVGSNEPGAEKYINDYPDVNCLSTEEFTLFYREVQRGDYEQSAFEKNLNNLEWVKHEVTFYHEIISSLAAGKNVVPLKFGTIFHETDQMVQSISAMKENFTHRLSAGEDFVEFILSFYYDISLKKKAVDSHIKEPQPKTGKAYLLAKKRTSDTNQELSRRLNDLRQKIKEKTEVRFSGIHILEEKTRHETGLENPMFFNLKVLSKRVQMDDNSDFIESLLSNEPGITFTLSNIWPPESFFSHAQ